MKINQKKLPQRNDETFFIRFATVLVCNSENAIDSKVAYDLFDSKDETIYVCSILEKLSLIEIINPTEGDPLYLINWTVNTCEFIKRGRFIKEYEQKDKKENGIKSTNDNSTLDKSIMNNLSKKLTIPIILSIIGGVFMFGYYVGTIKFDKDKISLSDENNVVKEERVKMIEKFDLLKDSINNIKTKISLDNNSSKKEILVYNNTNSQKRFYYFDKNERTGSGYLIKPKELFHKILLGNIYDYSFHNIDKKMNKIDTLKKGEFTIYIPRKEFLLIE